jgi:hypothetical protein
MGLHIQFHVPRLITWVLQNVNASRDIIKKQIYAIFALLDFIVLEEAITKQRVL